MPAPRAPTRRPGAKKSEVACGEPLNGSLSRVAPLCALLGQMIRPIHPSVSECWKALRHRDNLEGILRLLATKFNTSLLADYRCCLQPEF